MVAGRGGHVVAAGRRRGRPGAPFALERAGRWLEAAATWDELGSPFEAALALARSGDGAALAQAVGWFEAIGAVAGAARARALLRARGLPQPRLPRPATLAHPAGLTARQAEVLDLLREGLTDAEIADRLVLSRRTVEHHVGAVLAKLGVGSRSAAARGARRPDPRGFGACTRAGYRRPRGWVAAADPASEPAQIDLGRQTRPH